MYFITKKEVDEVFIYKTTNILCLTIKLVHIVKFKKYLILKTLSDEKMFLSTFVNKSFHSFRYQINMNKKYIHFISNTRTLKVVISCGNKKCFKHYLFGKVYSSVVPRIGQNKLYFILHLETEMFYATQSKNLHSILRCL